MTIMEKVHQHYEVAKNFVPENQIIGVFLVGSQNYGLDTSSSDVDTKCIYVPSMNDILYMRHPFSAEVEVGEDGGHISFVDIREFMRQIRKQNPNALEILFTKYWVRNYDFEQSWYKLYCSREHIARYHPAAAIDTARYFAHNYYTRMTRQGYTQKGLVNVLRFETMIVEYLEGDGSYEKCLKPVEDLEDLRNIKLGIKEYSPAEGMELAKQTIARMDAYVDQALSKYADKLKPNEKTDKFMDDFLKEIVSDFFKGELEENEH